jgi:hypothetical protein
MMPLDRVLEVAIERPHTISRPQPGWAWAEPLWVIAPVGHAIGYRDAAACRLGWSAHIDQAFPPVRARSTLQKSPKSAA